jgi:PAS domain S-box-containing protein
VERLSGFTPDELLGRSFEEAFAPESAAIARNGIDEVVRATASGDSVPSGRFDLELSRKDGSKVWTEATVNPLRGADGKILGLIGVTRDISDRQSAEAALRMVNHKLQLMNSITRHDLANRVTVLKGYASLLEEDPDADVQAASDRIGGICDEIDHLLNFTRLYQDLGTGRPQWQDVGSIFSSPSFRSLTDELTVEIGLEGLEVYADLLLEKVVYNLVENSLRHGEHVSRITVSGMERSGGYCLVYEDDGAGISPDEKERVFVQGHGKNTGLGLFFIRECWPPCRPACRTPGVPR